MEKKQINIELCDNGAVIQCGDIKVVAESDINISSRSAKEIAEWIGTEITAELLEMWEKNPSCFDYKIDYSIRQRRR